MTEQSDPKANPNESGEPSTAESTDSALPSGLADEPKASADEPKASAPQAEPEGSAALDASGRERPQFLLSFPNHPDLARLSLAFEAGNYALVRAEAASLAERAEDPAVRDAALELRRRIEPDPLVKYLLALTALLLLFLAYFAYNH